MKSLFTVIRAAATSKGACPGSLVERAAGSAGAGKGAMGDLPCGAGEASLEKVPGWERLKPQGNLPGSSDRGGGGT